MYKFVSIFLIISLSWSCGSNKKVEKVTTQKDAVIVNFSVGPPTIIYSTKGDYNNLVPVILSDDKSKITSFPHPSDIYYKGKLAYRTQLDEGYLLDNRGISKNVAFLSFTYDEYSKLDKVPSIDSLFALIVFKDPLVDMYNCGNRHQYKDEVGDLNSLIINGHLEQCKKVVGK